MISIPGSLSLFCQVGDDVIGPCKICGGCKIRVPRSIHSFIDRLIVPYNLDYKPFFLCRTQSRQKPCFLLGRKLYYQNTRFIFLATLLRRNNISEKVFLIYPRPRVLVSFKILNLIFSFPGLCPQGTLLVSGDRVFDLHLCPYCVLDTAHDCQGANKPIRLVQI